MEFHPQKCQVLHITSKRKPVKFLYNIHSQTLEEAITAKYLGVTIQNDLNWNKHIDATTKTANNTRAFLQRNIKQCPGKTKEPDTNTISARPYHEVPDTICQNFHIPEVLLPRHHQIVEQPSPDSSMLLDTRQLQGGSANRQTPLDSY